MNEVLPDSDQDVAVSNKVKKDMDDQIQSHHHVKYEDDRVKGNNKKKGTLNKRDQTTASDEEDKQEIAQQLKDKFITEEIDEIFGTIQDQKIVEEDIPERLQIRL